MVPEVQRIIFRRSERVFHHIQCLFITNVVYVASSHKMWIRRAVYTQTRFNISSDFISLWIRLLPGIGDWAAEQFQK